MTSRRDLIVGAALLAPLALTLKTVQATEHKEGEAHAKPQFLFVQSAEGVTYADGRLTLTGHQPHHHSVYKGNPR